MPTQLPSFPLTANSVKQFMQYMWEFLHDTPKEDRDLVWQTWIPRAYEVETESLIPSVEAGVQALSKEFRHDKRSH